MNAPQPVLLAYSTIDGHTQHITQHFGDALTKLGHSVVIKEVGDVTEQDVRDAPLVVLGASIRYGKHRPNVAAFVQTHRTQLQARRTAFFSVNVVARKPGKDTAPTNPYVQKFLKQTAWAPTLTEVFAGRIQYPRYGYFDRQMIRLIMRITHGPTDPTREFEFTDWRRVDAFAMALHQLA